MRYKLEDTDINLLREALDGASNAEIIVLCIGLTDIYESEGYDRETLSIPKNQIRLLEALYEINPNIVTVLVGGAAVEMPWLDKTKALLHMQLSGQAGGFAAADLLFGAVNPSGKLTETYPRNYNDMINSAYYGKNPKQVPYYESMYCGYRYFDSAEKDVLFPFGFGLSYTSFEYNDLKIKKSKAPEFEFSLTIKNNGTRDGAETVQLYIRPETGGAYRPCHELKGFAKVFLKVGEEKQIQLRLNQRSFAFYDCMRGVHTPPLWGETKGMYPETDSLPKQPYPVRFAVGLVDIKKKSWQVEEGNYTVEIGASSRDIRLTQRIKLEGIAVEKSKCASWYNTLDGTPGKKEFVSVYGDYADAVPEKKGNFGMENSIMEMKTSSFLCRFIYRGMESTIAKLAGGKVDYNNPQFRMLMNSSADNPIKANMLFSPDVMTEPFVRFVLDCANGHFWRGLFRLLSTRKRKIKQE